MKQITNALIAAFKEHLVDEEKAAATIAKYVRDTKVFMAWADGRPLEKATVVEYKRQLIETYAPASVNAALSSLNSFFEFCHWYELKVKALKIQRRIFAAQERELTKTEYERLLKAAASKKNKRLSLLMQTICSTGIRVSELKFITVEAVKKEEARIDCKGKMRIVILPKQLCKLLKVYIKEQKVETGAVFISKSGKPLNRSNIWGEMKRLCDLAGVPRDKVFPHNLRHLFARTYYSLQKDIVRLADILGHSSVDTTRIYTMESGEVHRQQIQKLGLVVMQI